MLSNFDATIALYEQFKSDIHGWPFPERAQVSVYSDSILVVSDELPPLLHTIVALHWAALMQGWLIRGGVAFGKYWENKDGGNLYVVSDALVRAVSLEKQIKVPAVVLSEEVPLGIEAWMPRFQHDVFKAPLLHFEGLTIVNPFNSYWFASAAIKARALREQHPDHSSKYDWFLSLVDAVSRDEVLVPPASLAEMVALGILKDLGASETSSRQ